MTGARLDVAAKLTKRISMAGPALWVTSGGEVPSCNQVAVSNEATAAMLVTQLSEGDHAVPASMAAPGPICFQRALALAITHATTTTPPAPANLIISGMRRSNPA